MSILPKSIRVGHLTYKVELVAHPGKDDDADGCTHNSRQLIELREGMPDYFTAVVLHHEIGHAVWYAFGGATGIEDDEKQEEHCINLLSAGYIMVERDNPALRRYYDATLRAGR